MDTSIRDGGGSYQPWSEKKDGDDKDEEPVVHTFLSTAKVMAVTGPLNIFLLCMPVAMVSYWMHWASGVTFILSLLALAPLAERLGFVTEQLAMHTNETIGGLLNATFGNATELIVAITALKRGLFRLVQLSLLGSILSNMLLVLGTAFWVGGYYHKIQKFGTISSQINSTLLMIATMGILFPTILTNSNEEDNKEELGYSRGTSIVLFTLYFAFLYFQVGLGGCTRASCVAVADIRKPCGVSECVCVSARAVLIDIFLFLNLTLSSFPTCPCTLDLRPYPLLSVLPSPPLSNIYLRSSSRTSFCTRSVQRRRRSSRSP
jgi:hypothetical protein